MTEALPLSTWVYVLVKDPGADEQLVGQHDPENDISFIPAFRNKEAGMQGIIHMVKEKGHKYEVQAVMLEELLRDASKGNFFVFVLDDEGVIEKKFAPDGRPL